MTCENLVFDRVFVHGQQCPVPRTEYTVRRLSAFASDSRGRADSLLLYYPRASSFVSICVIRGSLKPDEDREMTEQKNCHVLPTFTGGRVSRLPQPDSAAAVRAGIPRRPLS